MNPPVQRGSYMQISDVPTPPSDGPECHVSFSLFHSPLPFRLCLKIDFSVNLKIRWLGLAIGLLYEYGSVRWLVLVLVLVWTGWCWFF